MLLADSLTVMQAMSLFSIHENDRILAESAFACQ
jgi:hypothetical protein